MAGKLGRSGPTKANASTNGFPLSLALVLPKAGAKSCTVHLPCVVRALHGLCDAPRRRQGSSFELFEGVITQRPGLPTRSIHVYPYSCVALLLEGHAEFVSDLLRLRDANGDFCRLLRGHVRLKMAPREVAKAWSSAR